MSDLPLRNDIILTCAMCAAGIEISSRHAKWWGKMITLRRGTEDFCPTCVAPMLEYIRKNQLEIRQDTTL